jgi:hypothetical protein
MLQAVFIKFLDWGVRLECCRALCIGDAIDSPPAHATHTHMGLSSH